MGLLADLIEQKLGDAENKGIIDPIVLLLEQSEPRAHCICESLAHRPLKPIDIADSFRGAVEVASRVDTIKLLKRHADEAGSIIADALGELPLPLPETRVAVRCDECTLITDAGPRTEYVEVLGYHSDAVHMSYSCREWQPWLNVARVHLPDKRIAVVCGEYAIVREAANLIVTVTTRSVKGRAISDETLARHLKKCTPKVIAEAIRGLQKLGTYEEYWLLQVLWSRTNLRDLAKEVANQLAGPFEPWV